MKLPKTTFFFVLVEMKFAADMSFVCVINLYTTDCINVLPSCLVNTKVLYAEGDRASRNTLCANPLMRLHYGGYEEYIRRLLFGQENRRNIQSLIAHCCHEKLSQ